MFLGYNSNGFQNHSPHDALEILAESGYQGIGITVDHGWLNPASADFETRLAAFRKSLVGHRMRSVVETGARFLLDPRRRHQPTLVSEKEEDRNRRAGFLRQCINIAEALGSDCVSLWSGSPPPETSLQTAMDRLAASLEPILRYAEDKGVVIGFEPEPGMLIDTMQRYERLLQWLECDTLQLTLDVGHLWCNGELPIAGYIERWGSRIVNVHIEDMRAGVHEHLPFGAGEMEFPPILQALAETGYQGGVYVELSRHSHDAVRISGEAMEFLKPILDTVVSRRPIDPTHR